MSIPSVSPANQAKQIPQASHSGKERTSLGQQDFLNLFITQLKNQNPLNPLDHFQMASQLVQFNQLDLLVRLHQSMETTNAYQSSIHGLQAAHLIGKRMAFETSHLFLKDGRASEGSYQLSRPGWVRIEIHNEMGQLVRILEEGFKGTDRQTFVWDGKSQGGLSQPDGKYFFKILAVDDRGGPIPVDRSRLETITGVQFDNGTIYLFGGSERVSLSEVRAILNGSQ
ncbi:MAG: flagellar hook assembly protein FlgD [Desulfobacterota bacterium]|nr:flagellar hook assembly protein FlgD [Thermodesulfobacteriota bacterium]